MDATRMTRMIKELMKLFQDISESREDYDYERVRHEVEEIKEELGSWYIANYPLYLGS